MKKSVKILLIVLAVVLVAGGVLLILLGRGDSTIGREEALSIALDQAGLAKSDVDDIDIDLKRRKNGNSRYEIDFEYLGADYDCFIDAVTGQVLAFFGEGRTLSGDFQTFNPSQSTGAPAGTPAPTQSTEAPAQQSQAPAQQSQAPAQSPVPTQSGAALISREEALGIALGDLGFQESEVYDIDIELDRQRGVQVYDIDFENQDTEFDYAIDAVTGEILRMDASGKRQLNQSGSTASEDVIGREAALSAALAAAGLQESEVYDIDVELDRRIISAYYEVDFETASTEYEYDVDAFTGEILRSNVEPNH